MRQPWAWAIIHGDPPKVVENRSRNVAGSYRGPVAIHAGLAVDADAYDDPRVRHEIQQITDPGVPIERMAVRGAFLGVADLVDVHGGRPEEGAFGDTYAAACCSSSWAEFEMVEVRALCEREPSYVCSTVHLVLANPRPLPEPIPARGRLGLWTPPGEVLEQLQAVTQ